MYCVILLFNQRRHIVFESHYLGKKESLEGSKTSAPEYPSLSRGLHSVLEAPHKYDPHVFSGLSIFISCAPVSSNQMTRMYIGVIYYVLFRWYFVVFIFYVDIKGLLTEKSDRFRNYFEKKGLL